MNMVATLETLADQIKAEHALAVRCAESALDHAFTTGQLLIQAKVAVGHGAWLEWMWSNCDVSERQAQRYMRLASGKNDTVSHLSQRAALAELAAPAPRPPVRPDATAPKITRGRLPVAECHGRSEAPEPDIEDDDDPPAPPLISPEKTWRWIDASPSMRTFAMEVAARDRHERVYAVVLLMDLLGVEDQLAECFRVRRDAEGA